MAGARSAGCEKTVIAGDITAKGAGTVREQPAFGGPVSGLAAAMKQVETDWLMLLACDLPHARLLCHLLTESFHSITSDFDGLVALTDFRIQWLAGIYRRSSLQRELERIRDPQGMALKELFGNMKLREVQDPEGFARDIDTPEDLASIENGRNQA